MSLQARRIWYSRILCSIMSMRFKHSIQREGFSIVPLNKLEKANITFSIMGDMELKKEINNQMHGKDITI